MKGFLQEYGIIMVVVAVVLGMLAFGKTGYAKSIQDAILGSADHIVETGENITKKEVNVTAGDTLDIESTKYIVLEEKGNSQALVMTASSIRNMAFQSTSRSDKQSQNTYEDSEIGKVVDLKNKDKVKAFLNGNSIWTRHSFGPSPYPKNLICLLDYGTVATKEADYSLDVRPTFVIDLSKVDYTEAGHVDYK